MRVKNSQTHYGLISKAFHWVMALMVLGLLSVGFYMTGLPFSPFTLEIYALHKSIGMTVLALAVLRILWTGYTGWPQAMATHARWEIYLSGTVHFLLYVGLIAMPLSGWIMSSAGEFPNSYFGLFTVPDLVKKDEALFELFRAVHEFGAFALIAGLGLHIAGALKHQIIDKDTTLARMGGNTLMVVLGLMLLIPPLLFAGQSAVSESQIPTAGQKRETKDRLIPKTGPDLPQWGIDQDKTRIGFTFSLYGESVHGEFEDLEGEIYFDPAKPEAGYVNIRIKVGSISTGSADRDSQALSEAWFDAENHPYIQFRADTFKKINDGDFLARGTLKIREVTKKIELPFTLQTVRAEQGRKKAEMNAQITLNRMDFGIGQGQWSSGNAIGKNVRIDISLQAHTPPS